MSDPSRPSHDQRQIVDARHRELAVEHLLFQTLRELAADNPALLEKLEASIAHLWDTGPAETRDDEAVRNVPRTFLKSLRS